MKRAILAFILLTVVSGSAMAKWIYVGTNFGETSEPLYFTFVDSGIEVTELKNIVKIRTLNKYANVQKEPNQILYLSTKKTIKYDCLAGNMQILSTSAHSKRNGEGETFIINNKPLPWIAVFSYGKEIEKKLFKFACNMLAGNPDKTGTEWVSIGMFEDQKNLYVIPSSVLKTKSGNLMNLWGMTDRSIASEEGIMSTQWYFQFDCKKREYDMLDITTYSKNMGSGKVISHFSRGRSWRLSKFKPNGVTEKFFNYACGK